MTDKPFGVNLTILPAIKPPPYAEYRQRHHRVRHQDRRDRRLQAARSIVADFKKHGIKVIHKCTAARHAVSAQRMGVDAISIDGFECAGHPGEDDIPGLILIPADGRQDQDSDDRLRRLRRRARPGGGAGARRRRHQHGHALHGHEGSRRSTRTSSNSIVANDERATDLIFRTMRNTARVAKNAVEPEGRRHGEGGRAASRR